MVNSSTCARPIRRLLRRAFSLSFASIGVLATAMMALPIVSAGTARAQAIDIPAVLSPDLQAPPTVATLRYGHQFKTDVEDPGTEMSRDTAFFGLGHRFKLGEDTTLFALGNYSFSNYDFSGTNSPGNFYRWDDVHRAVVSGIVGHDLNERWRILGGAVLRSWGEGGARFGDSITGGLLGGFDYHPNENFSVGLLVGAFSALEDSVGLLPVPMVKWKFADAWLLNVGMVAVMEPGLGLEIQWQTSETVTLGLGATTQNRRFRLADKTRVAGVTGRTDDGGVGQESEFPVFAQVRWRPAPKTVIDLLGGVSLNGNLRVEDEDGGYISDDDYDAAPFLGLKAQFFF